MADLAQTPNLDPGNEPSPLDSVGPVATLIALTEQLTALVQEEIRILEKRRPRDIEPLQTEKTRLGTLYAEQFSLVRQRPELLGEPRSSLRLALREVTQAFHEELLKLGRVLIRFRTVTEGIVQSISDEVTKRQPRVNTYSPAASIAGSRLNAPVPLTFDQVI